MNEYRNRTRELPPDTLNNGVYGSSQAATFLQDVLDGTDSLDIVTFGDSNVGNEFGGYTQGFVSALGNLGAAEYATALTFTSYRDAADRNTVTGRYFHPFQKATWSGTNTAGATGSVTTVTTAAGSNTDASAISSYFGTITNLKQYGWLYDAAFVAGGTTYTSGANGPGIALVAGGPLAAGGGAAGVSLQYRVLYGKFTSTANSGKFRLVAMKGVNTRVAQSASDIVTTGHAAIGHDLATLNFTSSTTTGTPDTMTCSWEGYNNGATYSAAGPVAIFWHSVIKLAAKGYSVTNLQYYGGRTSTNLATDLSSMNKSLEIFLKELHDRQQAAGGSGRVLFFVNSGTNGPDSSTTWTAAAESIRDTLRTKWAAAGLDADKLAIVFTVTHPATTGTWSTARPAVASAANAWALGNAPDKYVTVVDINNLFTAAQLLARNFYNVSSNAVDQAHLRSLPYTSYIGGNPTPHWYPTTFGENYGDGRIVNHGYGAVSLRIINALTQTL